MVAAEGRQRSGRGVIEAFRQVSPAARSALGAAMNRVPHLRLRVLLLDRRNRVIGLRVIYLGNCYSAVVRLAEVTRPAVMAAVPNLIVVHNHPSGDPAPSTNDVDITKALAEAATLLVGELLDHVVIGDEAVSLGERGLFG